MANDYILVAESPDKLKVALFTPSVVTLPSGRLLAAYERGRIRDDYRAYIVSSDDGGKTWTERHAVGISHGRLFLAGGKVYYLGHAGNLRVIRSDDEGEHWTEVSELTEGEQRWHQSACNVWRANGNVYLVMEREMELTPKFWPVASIAPVLMRGREGADLTKRENWTFASELVFYDLFPGYKEGKEIGFEYFGVPFFPNEYGRRFPVAGKRTSSPIGWLEANVVQIKDPSHYWYDEKGKTFHLFMRAHTGGTGLAAMAKVVEQEDGTMRTELEKVPSGKTILYVPMPGGQMRFHVLYDEVTKLYWLLSSQATDSMTRADLLPAERYDLPNNERHRLVLHFSKNMVDWCFAGLVTAGKTPKESRHYAAMEIDGEDLLIITRAADGTTRSAHSTNLITLHRVRNFRELVY